MKEGIAVDPLFPECELEAHDFGQAQPDALPMWHSHDLYQAKLDCFK